MPELRSLHGGCSCRHPAGPLLGREHVGALNELLEASERRRLTSPVRPVGPDEIADPHGSFEPPAQCCVHTNLLLSSARCRDSCRRVLTSPDAGRPCAISGPSRLTVERGPSARFCPHVRTKNSWVNGRFLGSGPWCIGRCPWIASRSALIVASGPLIGATSALAG